MDQLTIKPLEKEVDPTADREIANRYKHIPGWGMDADPNNNPTYPMKHYTGADHQRLEYEKAPQQRTDIEVLRSIERPTITRVYGTSVPPSGLSGIIRRQAYKYSEADARHWMTLILADRINVIEGIISDIAKGIIPNLWIEKGWRAEWKTNKTGVVKKIATGVVLTTVIVLLIMQKRKLKANRLARLSM